MTTAQIQDHMNDLTDDELRQSIATAKTDLENAAADEPHSEWHQACFAGLLMYAHEASLRGIIIAKVH